MLRTIVFFLLSAITLGALATPGFALLGALLFVLFLFAAPIWFIGLAVTTRGHPAEAVVRTKHARLLGPGGPDDPFAEVPYESE